MIHPFDIGRDPFSMVQGIEATLLCEHIAEVKTTWLASYEARTRLRELLKVVSHD